MAKKKKKKTAKRAVRKPKKKSKVAKKRVAKKNTSVRKATRVGKQTLSTVAKVLMPTAVAASVLPRVEPPARAAKPQSARQDSLREAIPDDLELDDDLADEVPKAMRDEMDDEESLDEEGRRGDYLDKPDELSGEDEE